MRNNLVLPFLGFLLLTGAGTISAQPLELNLTPTDYNGQHVSCFGSRDGALDLEITGGQPPYTIAWSTGETTEDIDSLAAGYYIVRVLDAYSTEAFAEITLSEPRKLEVEMVAFTYPGGLNISCNNCYNGSIALTVEGGTAPYSYLWNDGATVEDRSGLGSANFEVEVTDQNQCVHRTASVFLREPERDDWTNSGNAGTVPGTHYLGTSDNKDLVLKTNGAESFRLLSTGELKAIGLATPSKYSTLFADSNGVLKSWASMNAEMINEGILPKPGCPKWEAVPWTLCGNYVWDGNFLGTTNARALVIKTHGITRMIIDKDGKVGIGVEPPIGSTSIYQLYVHEGIMTRDVKVTINTFNDHVFAPEYDLMSLDELRHYLAEHRHLPGIPSESEIKAGEGVELGEFQMKMLKVAEEQALYILELQEQLEALKAELKVVREQLNER